MKSKSMKKNAALMMLKTIVSLFIPLITFPYVSRVLCVEEIGQYNFSDSIVSYFILIAGLGISTYAIREGAKIREDRERFSIFASEIYLINRLSSVTAIILLIILVVCVPKIRSYETLIFILGAQILFTTYGRSWIYNIYEDFYYVTILQLTFNVLSVAFLLIFVREPGDVVAYTVIHVVSSVGANLLYGLRQKKYYDIKQVRLKELKKHLKPILYIFSTSIATTIYVNSDVTILGWLIDDECVGLYSVAVKVYTMIKQVMVAVITVTVPRLTLYANTKKFNPLFKKVINTLLLLVLPTTTGLFMTSSNIIRIIAGEKYIDAIMSLRLLSIALLFALLACLFGTSVLLPYMKEKKFLNSTIVSAVVNIVLNFILIPRFRQNAAAFTTVLSQVIAFVICYWYSKEYVDIKGYTRTISIMLLGCMSIVVSCLFVNMIGLLNILETFLKVIVGGGAYFLIQLIFKNEYFIEPLMGIMRRINRNETL